MWLAVFEQHSNRLLTAVEAAHQPGAGGIFPFSSRPGTNGTNGTNGTTQKTGAVGLFSADFKHTQYKKMEIVSPKALLRERKSCKSMFRENHLLDHAVNIILETLNNILKNAHGPERVLNKH